MVPLLLLAVSSVLSVVSNSLQPHGLQHTRLPCPSPSPRATQTYVPRVGDAIQLSHPLLSVSLKAQVAECLRPHHPLSRAFLLTWLLPSAPCPHPGPGRLWLFPLAGGAHQFPCPWPHGPSAPCCTGETRGQDSAQVCGWRKRRTQRPPVCAVSGTPGLAWCPSSGFGGPQLRG